MEAAEKNRETHIGYAYFNPDTGWEWRPSHPIESGECDDASQISMMTLAKFERRHPL